MSFSNYVLGQAPPARTKSIKKPAASASRPSSRPVSRDVDDEAALPTPPPEEKRAKKAELSDKAAKLMGFKPRQERTSASAQRRKAGPRDPYAIDDSDDLVMVDMDDAGGQSAKDGSRGSKPSKRKSKRGDDEDGVIVDAEQTQNGPEVHSGPDDLAIVDGPLRERRLKRSNTAPKKPEPGKLMGLFGSLRKTAPRQENLPERRKSRSYRGGDDTEREDARRARREDRRKRSVKPDTDGEGFTTDAAPGVGGADTEAEDAEARRAARKARRVSRQVSDARDPDVEERRAKRKEKERAREAREQKAREDEEERRREEKRARRAAREERRAKEEQAAREAEAMAAERRERRRMREDEVAAKTRRRRSRVEEKPPAEDQSPDEPEVERRAPRVSRAVDESKSRRRKSKAIPDTAPPPQMSGGLNHGVPKKDKISSWVKSQADEPPEPPPIMPTVVDMLPQAAAAAEGNERSLSSDEEARRALRRKAAAVPPGTVEMRTLMTRALLVGGIPVARA
ncbi:hypothetical protein N7510_004336 [Penicillium lagena]|uniref:uncharacterized protein n=1 Tax=Penicillium lagena TaxID=94218 RepID=UPI00254007EF|nr:uncharacterized protein N7510_004336 [Penicillium lagena]KAJ5620352.1 hypothetical protein N7510_004336 [Penicillium lagena]